MNANRSRRLVRVLLRATTAAVLIAVVPTMVVLGANTVTQVITAGSRSASVANLTLGSLAYSHSAQTNTGTMTLTADDSTGSNLGWNVTIQSSDFVYSGSASGSDIPAANFSLTSASAATRTAGQAVDATGGPKVPAISPVGTLDSARKVLQALVLFGNGTYTQSLGVSLDIPAQAAQGTYTGTLTTTISAAP
jgi:WxL domain surface cell wall-binding